MREGLESGLEQPAAQAASVLSWGLPLAALAALGALGVWALPMAGSAASPPGLDAWLALAGWQQALSLLGLPPLCARRGALRLRGRG